jgi:cellulose synthase/poly-beta-1,6-N-acetylglucosamine synthase-like glycosyltransferase
MHSVKLEKNDKLIQRIFEIVPGFLAWTVILSPVWLGLIYPRAVVYFLTFLTLYWSYLAIINTVGLIIGYRRHAKEMKQDWLAKCSELDFSQLPDKKTLPPSLEETRHFVLIPCVNEPYEVLKESFTAYLEQTYPTERVILVYTVEEKYAKQTKENIKKIVLPHLDRFEEILIFIHPAGIPGEAKGVGGANRTWGASHAVAYLEQKEKEIRNYIFSTFDADHIPDKQYLARLTHLYLSTDRRDNHFYSTSLHLFNNNHWRVPSMPRIEANFVTLGTLSSRSVPWGLSTLTKDTFAAYSCSLQTLIDADYWDVQLGVDDTIFFWRAYLVRDGDFKLADHYIPYSADAVEGKNYWEAHKSLYKQLLRWGWGALEVPLSIKIFIKNKNIPLSKKVLWVYYHFKNRVIKFNIVFLLTFGFAILTMVNPAVKQSSFAYSLPDAMSWILTFTLAFLIPPTYYRARLTPPMPREWSIFRKVAMNLEGLLVMANLLTFSFFPFIDAQTRMMFGKRMKDLYHTPKVR